MQRLRFQNVCVIAAVLLLLTFLFIKTRAINPDEHNRFSRDLRELRGSDATLNENILKARYGLLTSYDQLVAENEDIKRIQADLQNIPSFVDEPARRQLLRELSAYAQLQQRKEASIEQFKSRNAVINNSLRYFPIAASMLTAKGATEKNGRGTATQAGREITAGANNLLRDVLIYYLAADEELSPQINAQMEALLRRGPAKAEASDLGITVSHARTILRLRPEIDALVKDLVSLPTAAKSEDLLKLYSSQYEQAMRSTNTYRLFLVAFSTLLLGYIGLIIAKLKRATRALNAVNESLEQRVEARTAELSWSNNELRKSEANNRALIHAIPDSMWRTDSSGVFLDIRAAKGEELKIPAGEWAGKSIDRVLPQDIAGQFLSQMKQALETGSTQIFEYELDGDESLNHYEARISLSGENELLTVVRNTTERRQLEGQLRQAQKLESIGQLAAGIAHEINTPTQYVGDNTRFLQDSFKELLDAMQRQTELLATAPDGAETSALKDEARAISDEADLEYLCDEIPKAIRQSLEGVEQISKIVQSMKDFAHPGSAQKKMADLNQALESTITVARNEWKYVAEIVTEFDPQLPAVPCLLGELNQVVLNLIINATHAVAEKLKRDEGSKGVIKVTTGREDEWAVIRISDTGIGIPRAVRSKIFDPFFTTKDVGKGTGQGLAISHRVVKKHGGTITFETEEGVGTTFVIRLPLAEAVPAEQEERALAC